MTHNERELIELCKTPQVADFMHKAVLCWLAHGESFMETVQEYLNNGDVDGMIDLVNRESQAIA